MNSNYLKDESVISQSFLDLTRTDLNKSQIISEIISQKDHDKLQWFSKNILKVCSLKGSIKSLSDGISPCRSYVSIYYGSCFYAHDII